MPEFTRILALLVALILPTTALALDFTTFEPGFYDGSEVSFVFPGDNENLPYTDPVSQIALSGMGQVNFETISIGNSPFLLTVDLPMSAERVGFGVPFLSAGFLIFEAFDGTDSLGSMAFQFTNGDPAAPQNFIGTIAGAGEEITRVEVIGTVATFGGVPSFNVDDLRFIVPEPSSSFLGVASLASLTSLICFRKVIRRR